MRSLAQLESALERTEPGSQDPGAAANQLLAIGEEVLEHWVSARGVDPTDAAHEGFRLLALQRQGAKGDPSFNACRETCREVAYHYNLVTMQPDAGKSTYRLEMMKMVCNHLFLFISGKLQEASLGEFCCSSKPVRLRSDDGVPTA